MASSSDESEFEDLLLGAHILHENEEKENKSKAKKRQYCVREIFKNKNQYGLYHNLVKVMRLIDRENFLK